MPLANSLLSGEQLTQTEETFPLDLVFCPNCSLAQITETVPPQKLFGEYLYFSSFSDTMLRHAQELVERLYSTREWNDTSRVIEIASNDGYLLQYYQRRGISVLGIEPAANVARVAQNERSIRTLVDFFGDSLAARLRDEGESADVIHAHNVLAHVADLNGVVRGIALLLKENGVAVIEVPYVKDLIDRCEFDTIYHEHLCYFSLTALNNLFQRHGLTIQDVERISIHGGSLRLFVAKNAVVGESARALLAEEARAGVDRAGYYRDFARQVVALKTELTARLQQWKQAGKRIAAYGAAAKGATLLNYLQIEHGVLDFVADRSPHKQGRYVPGVRLPIFSPQKLLDALPDYVLLLAWNLADEILAQQAEYRRRGGKFVIPVPQVRVV